LGKDNKVPNGEGVRLKEEHGGEGEEGKFYSLPSLLLPPSPPCPLFL